MLKIVVCVSGGGTNLQAILDAMDSGKITNTEVLAVISNNAGAKALERARMHHIPGILMSPGEYPDRAAFNRAFTDKMCELSPDLVVLAGFLVKIPEEMVARFRNRIINIHPSLIPSFCGVGYYGLKVHEKALERGVRVTGATVHFVNEGMDEGPIIAQKAVEVREDDTPETLQRRVMEQAEWILLPQAIDDIANGRLTVENGRVSRKRGKMKVLIVGGGGREHAIAASMKKSSRVEKIYCVPGNAGIAQIAECEPSIGVMEFDRIIAYAKEKAVDLVFVAPDDPLAGGLVDWLKEAGLRAFGPDRKAAILEASKAFSKDLMKKYHIPTAAYETFDDADRALAYLETAKMPIVLKADGLALGKGVLICNTLEEARAGVKEIMQDKHFGSAGNRMVIEEYMTGREVSVLSFVDGRTVKPMTSAQDHKRARDGDQGPNTGGMGNFSPSPFYTEEVDAFCRKYIYQPTVDAMAAEGRPFKGVIFFGLMLTPDGPRVLEYNARFGDPEAQVVLCRMKNDLMDVVDACIDGTLDEVELEFEDNAAVCVVLASDGYPVSYEKGFEIKGLEKFDGKEDYYCFHAGSRFDEQGRVVTNGGRVLGVTAKGATLREARAKAYEAAEWVDFENKYMRHDIGKAIDEA